MYTFVEGFLIFLSNGLRVLIFNDDCVCGVRLGAFLCAGPVFLRLGGGRRRNMSRFLSGYLRQIGWSFAAAALLGGVLLLVMGALARIGALLAGGAVLLAAGAASPARLARHCCGRARAGAARPRVDAGADLRGPLGGEHDGRTAFLRGGRRVFPAARGDDDAADCPRDAFR